MNRSRLERGTSLIELLVVIVILLIGILGVVQVFPGGFGVLRDRAKATEATQLAGTMIDTLKSHSEQLPEMIVPVIYLWNGSNVTIVTDPSRNNNDFSIAGGGVAQNGEVIDAMNNQLGQWQYLGAANIMRRIIGEGGRVPAPRQVGPATFGGLMVLQFAPIVYNAQYSNLFIVYGNEMVRGYGDPGFRPARPWQYFLEDADEPNGRLYLPRPAINNFNGRWVYRVQMTCWVSDGANTFRRDVIGQTANVPFVVGGGWQAFDLSTLAGLGGGETFVGADWDTVRVQHVFDEVPTFTGGSEVYEYQLLDANLGVLLFPPNAYDHQERRPGNRRVPLVSRVDYDVYDWRIIRDDFRVVDEDPYQAKLTLRNIKVINGFEADNTTYLGMPIPIPDGVGGTRQSDVILLDVETGAIVLHDPNNPPDPTPPVGTTSDYMSVDPTRSSFVVDKSIGLVRFIDADRTTPGLQIRIIYPGDTVPTIVNASGRLLRALYRANGEWSVQVLKAPATFNRAYGTPSVAQFYVGQTPLPNPPGGVGPGSATRIYFPGMDVGKKVVIGEIHYISGGTQQVMRDQEFTIRPAAGDPVGAFAEITEIDPGATTFDWSVGAPVKRVKGASVSVRVLWNPSSFTLGPDPTANLQAIERWGRNWRRYTVETYLQRGED
ncbi:MAG: hypothetical protein KF784_02040 [Fimbriimonadaceae bacterium]|nr:hypothetical protein [Fimbriimonadaceae bacterium]